MTNVPGKSQEDGFTPGWTFGPQDGTPGHFFVAQVWDANGKRMALVRWTANAPAAAIAKARKVSP